ncbi:MAG TPA: efflux RND transporter periplasmic adaptor subunit, partial [Pseudoxanthomonas sp.]|nr:efflux RND transporter periplasmic adaptor subunit [Pseudoxanthomonas sp.]
MSIRSGSRALAAAIFACALASCGGKDPAPQGPRGDRPIPVTTAVVRTSEWVDELQALGTVKARESVTLTSKVSEVVANVHFESGDQVRAGAPIITLRGDAQRAALAEAQAAYAEAEQLFERQSELIEQQLIARSQLDTQRAARDSALARVQQVRADIGDRAVRAPFGGVLGLRQVSPGSLITPTTAIATLDDISRVYVDFQVPEASLASVRNGSRVGGTTAAYRDRTFAGEVSAVDARIDPATRAVSVRADFPNAERLLRPGMLMGVRLFQPPRQAIAVPEIAVVQVGRDSFVYRVKEDG